MAERIVSPGVFTNEVDQSFLAGGVAQIGAAIVGPTVKGPALIPTQITSYGQFENIFGGYTDDVNSYVPYVVQDYLRNGNVITVTRLLYENGYKLTNGALAIVASSGSVNVVTHVLHPVQAVTTNGASNVFENSIIQNGTSGSFAITVSGSFSVATGTDASAIGFNGSFNVSQATAISASRTRAIACPSLAPSSAIDCASLISCSSIANAIDAESPRAFTLSLSLSILSVSYICASS
jgi:3-phosphoglycerate kinase